MLPVSAIKLKRTIESEGQIMYDLRPGGLGMAKGAGLKVGVGMKGLGDYDDDEDDDDCNDDGRRIPMKFSRNAVDDSHQRC